MALLGQFLTMTAGALAAGYLDRTFPEHSQQVAGVTVTPGAMAAGAGLLGLAVLGARVPARQTVASGLFGAALYEGVKVGEQQLLPMLEGAKGPAVVPPGSIPTTPQAAARMYQGVAGSLPSYAYSPTDYDLVASLSRFRAA